VSGLVSGSYFLYGHLYWIEALRDENFFKLLFVDVGAWCWPNGLELSPARLYENCNMTAAAWGLGEGQPRRGPCRYAA